ncbi:hypothetical protein BBJ28_00022306 [Nothophytophthora sp. Chile5]|nr:hypothetical protein BBJ28_00022306 [Nothophytophthora sp. Chile5]
MSSTREPVPTTEVATTAAPTETEQPPVYHLHLRPRPRVTFDDSVVDNEHLGRKKSNIDQSGGMGVLCANKECCIFHKKREFGESSSESGEDSDDSGDGGHEHDQHAHNCQHKARRRRTQPKKRAPSPSSSDEEKMPVPSQ